MGKKNGGNPGLILTDDLVSSVKEIFISRDGSPSSVPEMYHTAGELLHQHGLKDFSPEELGQAYENLHSDRSSRKKGGIFYTPQNIVERILAETFDAWVDVNPGKVPTILEPSCGAGAFALKIIERMQHLCRGGQCGSPDDVTIHLNDIDEGAQAMISLCTCLKSREINDDDVSRIPIKVTGHDFLDVSSWDEEACCGNVEPFYDIIVGNPPYISYYARGSQGIDKEHREELKKYFISASGRINTYLLFIERGIKLLKPGGRLGFIIPNTFLIMKSYEKLRKYVLDNCHLRYVADLSLGVFSGAEVPCCILVLEKRDPEELGLDHPVKISRPVGVGKSEDVELDTGRFRKLPYLMFNVGLDAATCRIIDRMEAGAEQLGMFVDVRDGINPANIKKKLVSKQNLGPNYKKVLVGRDISPFQLDWSGLFVNYDYSAVDKENGEYCFLREERIFLAEKKLVNRQTSRRLVVALDEDQHYALNSCHITLMENDKLDIHYLLALYNSDLINFYYTAVFRENESVFPQVKTANTEKLPIKFGSAEQLAIIVAVSVELSGRQNGNGKPVGVDIDSLLAEIYGLSSRDLEFAKSRVPR